MDAGRELDALVAARVMGCEVDRGLIVHALRQPARVEPRCGCDPCRHGSANEEDHPDALPQYSTEIAAAWQVVEKMEWRTEGYALVYDVLSEKWVAGSAVSEARAATAPLAICLAALRGVGAEVPA